MGPDWLLGASDNKSDPYLVSNSHAVLGTPRLFEMNFHSRSTKRFLTGFETKIKSRNWLNGTYQDLCQSAVLASWVLIGWSELVKNQSDTHFDSFQLTRTHSVQSRQFPTCTNSFGAILTISNWHELKSFRPWRSFRRAAWAPSWAGPRPRLQHPEVFSY